MKAAEAAASAAALRAAGGFSVSLREALDEAHNAVALMAPTKPGATS